MSAAPAFPPPVQPQARTAAQSDLAAPRFEFLLRSDPRDAARRRRTTVTVSLAAHAVAIAGLLLVPLLFFEPALPEVGEAVRAFFVMPQDAPPPPPPPPPPAPGPRPVRAAVVQPTPPPTAFVAPIEVPDQIKLEVASLDLGIEGGVPGGVEGGVPGGVVGGVVGGLPAAPPPPPAKVVRIGGKVVAPKLVHRVEPVYPAIAVQARAQAIMILEAHVGTDGRVKDVTILRGQPLFDDAALEAVRQWRYQPLLLNGLPTEFVLTVTLVFKIQAVEQH